MQDPIVFTGSLAENLDPMKACSRDALIDVAQRIGLVKASLSHHEASEALDAPTVLPSGDGLSNSERQLLCLGRALLRKCKICLFDEATSSLDAATDRQLQRALMALCDGTTTMTIAHRIQTVLDADRIIVVASGTIAESGPPAQLAANPESHLAKLLAA
jgi:ABC-type multidrug transport system fused ATPase/permease subunit